jgi:hypothetical protein
MQAGLLGTPWKHKLGKENVDSEPFNLAASASFCLHRGSGRRTPSLHDDQARHRSCYRSRNRNRNRHGGVVRRRDQLVRHRHWRFEGGSNGILG